MTAPNSFRLEFNATDDDSEFDWYTPVAVILKPASQKELKRRLQEDDGISQFSPLFPDYYHQAIPPWPSIQDPWEFNAQSPYQSREYDDDRLSQVYNSYDLPDNIQGRLLSLARMGLVAIPKEEIVSRSGEINLTNQEEHGTRIMFSVIFNIYYFLKSPLKKMYSSDHNHANIQILMPFYQRGINANKSIHSYLGYTT